MTGLNAAQYHNLEVLNPKYRHVKPLEGEQQGDRGYLPILMKANVHPDFSKYKSGSIFLSRCHPFSLDVHYVWAPFQDIYVSTPLFLQNSVQNPSSL